eukprot:s100_g12.t1
MIAPLVEDMSTTSSEYWALLKRETEEWYRTYLVSDPMARLQLQPSTLGQCPVAFVKVEQAEQKVGGVADYSLTQGSPGRTDSGEGQVTASPPVQTSCVVCAWRGAGARAFTAQPPESRSCWERPSCIGVPPPVEEMALKNGALLTIVKTVLEGNAEVVHQLHAALLSEVEVVHQLHAALLSEVEVLARTQTLKPRAQTSAAAVSAGENPPPGPKAATTGGGKGASKGEGQSSKSQDPAIPVPQGACRFYVQGIGCKRGDKCRNAHNWQDIPPKEKKSRCMSCGGVGHQRAACPHVPFLAKPAPPAPPRKPDKPERAEKPKAGAVAATPNQVQALLEDAAKVLKTIQGAGTPGQGSERLETSAPKAAPNAPPALQATPVTVSSLQSHLDAIRQAIPEAVKVLEVCPAETKGVEEADPDEATGLLDSGATHAVRARELKDQEVSAREVVLAGGATQSLLQNRGGTILTEGPSQPIVPLGSWAAL